MPSTLAVSQPDELAARIDQLVTLTNSDTEPYHDAYVANNDDITKAIAQEPSEPQREALIRAQRAASEDHAAFLAEIAAGKLEDRGDYPDADAMRKEAAARHEIAAGMRSDPNPEPPAPEPPGGREWPRGYEPKGTDMGGTNPDIVFEETRESVQPGGGDYSALRQQPTPAAVIEEEPQRPASRVAAQELGDQVTGADMTEAALEPIPEPHRPANTEPNATVTMGVTSVPTPGGDILMTYQQEIRHAEHNAAEQIDPPAPESVPQQEALKEEPQQAAPEAAPVQIAELQEAARETTQPQAAPEQDAAQIDPAAAYVRGVDTYLAAQQEAAGATPQEMAATVAMLDDQPTEQDIPNAAVLRQAAEESAKQQEAELPGAENLAPSVESGNSMADQFRAAYESIKAERAGLEQGNEQENGQEQDGHTAAFRSFGRRD